MADLFHGIILHHLQKGRYQILPPFLLIVFLNDNNENEQKNELTALRKQLLNKPRKNTFQRLQLKIIHESNSMDKMNRYTTFCGCCKDYEEPLSMEERTVILICGYIRENTNEYHVAIEIFEICTNYVGASNGFSETQLQSKNERKRIERARYRKKCEDCIYCLCCGICRGCMDNYCCDDDCCEAVFGNTFMIICMILFLLTFLFGKDIAGLVIFGYNYCEDANMWLIWATVPHIVFLALMACCSCILFRKYFENRWVIICFFLVCECYFVGWSIYGIIEYRGMQEEICRDIVLSWSIIQMIELSSAILIPAFFLMLLFCGCWDMGS